VQLADGLYSVSLCTDDGKCATGGAGTTDYRFRTPEAAKEVAAELQSIREAPKTTAVLVP
jgi:hypothetical protein